MAGFRSKGRSKPKGKRKSLRGHDNLWHGSASTSRGRRKWKRSAKKIDATFATRESYRGRTNPQRRMPHLVGHPDYGIVAVGSHHIYKGVEVEVLGDELDSRSVVVAPAGRGRPAVRVKVDELRPVRKNPGAYTIKINGKVVANYASGVTAIREFGRLLPQNRTKTVALYRHDELLNSVAPVEKRKRKNPSGLKWRHPNHAHEWIATKNGYKLRIDLHLGSYYLMYYEPGSKKAAWGGDYRSLAEAKSRAALIPQGG